MLARVLFASLFLLVLPRALADIGIGDSRATVLEQAGPPESRAQRGDREILLYPHGGRVELVDGRVTDVRGPLPTFAAPQPATPPIAETNAAQPATGPAPAPAAKPAVAAPSAALQAEILQQERLSNPSAAAEALGRSVEKMDTAWGTRPPLPVPSENVNWPKLLVLLVLHFGITLLALRIAFRIEGMDALWSGIFAIAAIDLAIYAVLEVLGPSTSGISSMGSVESGIGALVMVGTIQKFCFNKRLQNAVVTAMLVRGVVQLCHVFAFVFILHALFG